MKKFDVHLYAVIRVKVPGVEAEEEVAAIKEAEGSVDLHHLLSSDLSKHLPSNFRSKSCMKLSGMPILEAGYPREYAEEIVSYLVDEIEESEQCMDCMERERGNCAGIRSVKEETWFGPDPEKDRGNPNPDKAKAEAFDLIMNKPEVLPVLLGIDPDLDELIAAKLKS